ncbi:RtcB protein [Spraguea lophii 42_110]|uniref:3'-phosphate/5'-hydroxy nucleic acid ligase n=1 Tax=Spraguea lophii (strain 42_110) TaxID=1358809 RepID=S7WBP3_SPRLO|nr:RtcB protein [Spraguea lophii 42_110]
MTIIEEKNHKIKNIYKSKSIDLEILTDEKIDEISVEQLENITTIPKVKKVVVLPDIHGGYFFPIGCVAGIEDYIVPEGVGYDINCGVRVLRTGVLADKFLEVRNELGEAIRKKIPSGMYDKKNKKNSDGFLNNIDLQTLNKILDVGCDALKEFGIDSSYVENNGSLLGNSRIISQKAKSKGLKELGSLGSGNHYLEIQKIENILDKKIADTLNIKENEIIVMIHTGSRGVGHQILTDFKNISSDVYFDINSENGKKYIQMMNSAANFAFANRAVITERVKEVFKKFFDVEIALIYDASHNIASLEKTYINGEQKNIVIHRKGAATAQSSLDNLPSPYNLLGQPIPIGGSMGTASYILVSNKTDISLSSCAHGAGRIIARKDAKNKYTPEEIKNYLESKNIVVLANDKELLEEAPQNYKDIDKVVEQLENKNIIKRVCRLLPLLVIKG